MRHTWSDSNQFGQNLYFTKTQIDRMCSDELKKSGFYPDEPAPVNIERFVEKHYGKVDYLDLGEGYLGCTEFSKRGQVLRVIISSALDSDDTVTLRRLRTTLAHEAGHCMMHPVLFIEDGLQSTFKNENSEMFRQRKILCRDDDIGSTNKSSKTWDGRWWEYQANRAIGGFLLPKQLVIKALEGLTIKQGITESRTLSDGNRSKATHTVSETFNVNPIVAEIRIGEIYPANETQMML